MWGDKDEKKKKEAIVEEDHYTFLGKGVDFKGKASFDGTVRIDGHFEGEITAGGTLIIGEFAVIKGSITGGVIVSSGKVEGNIIASEKVQLLNSAVLIGDILAPSFSMEEGVIFQGLCDMGVSRLEDLGKSDSMENVHDLKTHRDHKLLSREA
jgi:cytoskeletal protein CcmA (bactofilin family)